LLHAIFETAVDDQMVRRNPCRIEGAGKEESSERAIVSVPIVFAIADALRVRYRAMALLATFTSMRWASWWAPAGRTSTWCPVTRAFSVGAGEGNGTLMTSLEGCGSQRLEQPQRRSGRLA
jgi:hypothetical protein